MKVGIMNNSEKIIKDYLIQSIAYLVRKGELPKECLEITPKVFRCKNRDQGDYYSNIAFVLSNLLKKLNENTK